jgi:serine/threonine protein kinase
VSGQGGLMVTSKTDMWSFGCTLVHMLTGHAPYRDTTNYWTVVYKVLPPCAGAGRPPPDVTHGTSVRRWGTRWPAQTSQITSPRACTTSCRRASSATPTRGQRPSSCCRSDAQLLVAVAAAAIAHWGRALLQALLVCKDELYSTPMSASKPPPLAIASPSGRGHGQPSPSISRRQQGSPAVLRTSSSQSTALRQSLAPAETSRQLPSRASGYANHPPTCGSLEGV